jgi:hypothetical protein
MPTPTMKKGRELTGIMAGVMLASCSNMCRPEPDHATEAGNAGRMRVVTTGAGNGGPSRTLIPSMPAAFSNYDLALCLKADRNRLIRSALAQDCSYRRHCAGRADHNRCGLCTGLEGTTSLPLVTMPRRGAGRTLAERPAKR